MRKPKLLIIGAFDCLLSFSVCAQVSSFNTRTGAVVLNSTDINTALSGQTLVVGAIASPVSGSTVQPLVFKNAAAGPLLLIMGGTSFDIEPNTDINLPGGAWGSGSLTNGVAPIFQNTTFTGSTSGAAASFGMFLQQFDNSSNTNNGVGISEHLVMNGSSSVGGREGAQVVLDINTTGNTSESTF